MGRSIHSARTRRVVIACAVAVLALAMTVAPTAAHHSRFERLSAGTMKSDGAVAAVFAGTSSDGTRVFFTTTEALVAADTDHVQDVYQRSGGTTTRVSAGAVNGNGAFSATFRGASSDGTRVFFETDEPLVAADTDTSQDVYERSGGTTTRISAGAVNGNGAFHAQFRGASSDGTRVFFMTDERLVAADTDSFDDVYERSGGTTTRVSAGAVNGNGASHAAYAGASSDGTRVFFETREPLVLSDADVVDDVYQRSGGTTSRVSAGAMNGNGAFGAAFMGASSNGARVFFYTTERLVAGDTDTFGDIYQRSGAGTTLVSAGAVNGNGAFHAFFAGASSDGTRVFFLTREQLVAADTDVVDDVYQRLGSTTTQVSAGAVNGNGAVAPFFAGASSDGTMVFFTTSEALVAADTDTFTDVYQRSGVTTRQVSTGPENGNGAIDAFFRGASSDGTQVFFTTSEPLVASDTDTFTDVYERSGRTTSPLSPGGGSFSASFNGTSDDGSAVFFSTQEKVIADDADTASDIYGAYRVP